MKGFGYKHIKTGKLKSYFGNTEAQVRFYLSRYEAGRKGFVIVQVELKEIKDSNYEVRV